MGETLYCPKCGKAFDSDMQFCTECGTPRPSAAAPGVPVSPTLPAGGPASSPESVAKAAKNGSMIIAALVSVIVVLVAVVFGMWWFILRDDDVSEPVVQDASDTSEAGGRSDGESVDDADDVGDSDEPAACLTVPDAELVGVWNSGDTLVADIALTSDECGDSAFEEDGVRVTLKNGDGNVIADAVYDFSASPIEFDDGEAAVRLAFGISQYWRPYDQIDASDVEIDLQTGATASGEPTAGTGDAMGGANVPDADVERNAQFALSWQREHDRTTASAFYTTYTTQLSSKQYGMQVEGRTWTYDDIYAQFLEKRARHPKALLVWSGDYPTYQKTGTTDYYVILSGEGFGSTADANAWCSSNGYTTNDCLAVDMQ